MTEIQTHFTLQKDILDSIELNSNANSINSIRTKFNSIEMNSNAISINSIQTQIRSNSIRTQIRLNSIQTQFKHKFD